jgi:ABC-2 type transport system ATP-binding protein
LIEARHLTKRFGGRTAIEDVSFRVACGEVVGLLGPNGAGKSTTFRLLAGIFPPDGGRALVDGLDLARDPLAARRRLGYLPERPPLYVDLTVEEQLGFVAALRDVPSAERGRAIDAAVARTNLAECRRRRIGGLSRGLQQRVGLAVGLVGDPAALLLDEPTVGLDPAQSAETRRTIRALGRERAVLVSSHILADVETLCDRVVILHQGRVLADGDPAMLVSRLRRPTYVDIEAAAAPARLVPLVEGVPGVRRVDVLATAAAGAREAQAETRGREYRCALRAEAANADVPARIAAALGEAGIALHALVPVEPSLEEAFLSLTGDGVRETP